MPFRDGKGSKAASEGAAREYRGAARENWGAVREERFWLLREPDLAALYSTTAAPVIYLIVLPGSVCWCLEFYSFVDSWLHLVLMKCFLTKAHCQRSLSEILIILISQALETKSR